MEGCTLASFFDNGPLPDWNDIKRMLGRDIPWNLVEQWEKSGNSDWLSKYIKEFLSKVKPEEQARTKQWVRMEAVKNPKSVTVNVKLPPNTDMRRMQLFASSERLKITGLPNESSQAIRFPCLVYPRSGKAEKKGDQLLVRFRRRPPSKSEYELFIRT
jgi:hypothetical protein